MWANGTDIDLGGLSFCCFEKLIMPLKSSHVLPICHLQFIFLGLKKLE